MADGEVAMGTVFQILFGLAAPFVQHPERSWMMAALFAMLLIGAVARERRLLVGRQLTMLLAAIAWGIFGLLESWAVANGYNIRVDMLVSWPIVLLLSGVGLWAGLTSPPAEQRKVRPAPGQ
jgi:hypothetical protein